VKWGIVIASAVARQRSATIVMGGFATVQIDIYTQHPARWSPRRLHRTRDQRYSSPRSSSFTRPCSECAHTATPTHDHPSLTRIAGGR
jgi:hypothetical protein